jgi:hypothetical protein
LKLDSGRGVLVTKMKAEIEVVWIREPRVTVLEWASVRVWNHDTTRDLKRDDGVQEICVDVVCLHVRAERLVGVVLAFVWFTKPAINLG